MRVMRTMWMMRVMRIRGEGEQAAQSGPNTQLGARFGVQLHCAWLLVCCWSAG